MKTNTSNKVKSMTIAALLSAIGIMIPMFAPSIRIEPASFTLASHVPVFIAMFISPPVAISVALISSFGFLIAGFLPVVVLRALTHLIFATIGAFILKKNGKILKSVKSTVLFAIFISAIHAVAEVTAVSLFYLVVGMPDAFKEKGYFVAVFGFVGLGTFIHSLIDFSIATVIWKALQHIVTIPTSARIRMNSSK